MSCLEQELGKTRLRLTANYSKMSLYQQPIVEDSDEELDYVANNSGAVNSELMAIPVTFCAGMPSPRLLYVFLCASHLTWKRRQKQKYQTPGRSTLGASILKAVTEDCCTKKYKN